MTTIFALSSGRPPSGVAVVRISGPAAFATLTALTQRSLPVPRQMVLRELAADGVPLDRALVVRFAGPDSATGEDVVELHLHGGSAVISGVLSALARLGLTPAGPGAFTRQAFDGGKLDLGQVEALGDLLAAETEMQRRAALAQVGGRLSRHVAHWRAVLLHVRAELEATLDFAEEDGVSATLTTASRDRLIELAAALREAEADSHRGALIRDGVTVVIVGPVNAGKSTLLNALARRDVAIVSDLPGTTRDLVEVRVSLRGQLVVVVDTAGHRKTTDPVELDGIRRAAARAATADLVIDLGSPPARNAIAVAAMCDRSGRASGWHDGVLHLSAITGEGIAVLEEHLADRAAKLTATGEPPLIVNARQRVALSRAYHAVIAALAGFDPIIVAEELRSAVSALEALIGRITSEDMLGEIFARFCIGK